MGTSTREEGILKLVHPGRHVEIYEEPIIAGEVLKKYPRHCIARPDVFKFPWIVVRPEAVLHPGKVFYLVPKKTIYDLLKAKRQQNQHMPLAIPTLNSHDNRDFTSLNTSENSILIENQYHKLRINVLKNRVNHSLPDWSSSFEGNQSMNNPGKLHFVHQNSPLKSTAGTTPKHFGHGKHRSRFKNSPRYGASYGKDDFKENMDNQSSNDSWIGATHKNRITHENFSQQSIDDSSFDSTFMHSKIYYDSQTSIYPVNYHRRYRISSNQAELKSCFRKPDSERGLLNLRVTFDIPVVRKM